MGLYGSRHDSPRCGTSLVSLRSEVQCGCVGFGLLGLLGCVKVRDKSGLEMGRFGPLRIASCLVRFKHVEVWLEVTGKGTQSYGISLA